MMNRFEIMRNVIHKKTITLTLVLVCLFAMLATAGCAHETLEAENVEENIPVDSSAEEQLPAEPVENTEPSDTTEKVEYSHEDIYLSLTIPDGWDYKIKTAEEMEKYDGTTICAIEFWQEDYPETVFTFSYESFFGICGTGVTTEEFTLESGISGYRYTEEIEDTLWLNMTFQNPEDVEEGVYKEGTYCIMASPKLSDWDVIKPEFEKIVESIWVAPH